MTKLTPCRFVFLDSPIFAGYAYGSTWNGFDNVAVTPAVRDQIVAYFSATQPQEDLDSFDIEPDEDGLISLRDGYATEIVETQYLATIRHHSISRARQIRIPGTLTEAMNKAAAEFGDEQRDYEIAIYEDMGDERMPKLVATRLVSGTEWRER